MIWNPVSHNIWFHTKIRLLLPLFLYIWKQFLMWYRDIDIIGNNIIFSQYPRKDMVIIRHYITCVKLHFCCWVWWVWEAFLCGNDYWYIFLNLRIKPKGGFTIISYHINTVMEDKRWFKAVIIIATKKHLSMFYHSFHSDDVSNSMLSSIILNYHFQSKTSSTEILFSVDLIMNSFIPSVKLNIYTSKLTTMKLKETLKT